MPNNQPPSIPVKTLSFNWDNVNLHEQWKLFSKQCKFLLINDGPFSKHPEPALIAAVLNWLGPRFYLVFNILNFDADVRGKSKKDDVLFMFESHFKPTQSVLQSWYQPGSIYSSQCKDQTEFMSKLHDVANDCSFANKNEVVNFLFLIHNTNERVKYQLKEKMKTTDSLTDILQLAQTVESTVQMETLSKQLLQKVGKLNTTTDVYAVQKCHHSKNKHFQSNSRSTSGRKASSWDKGGKKSGNCGHSHLPKQCPAYGKECFKCKMRNHFSKLCWSSDKKLDSGIGNPKCFSRKDIHKVEKSKFKYDTDIVAFKQIQVSTPVFNSRNDSPNSQISCLMKCQSKNLHWALTDVCLENRAGISSWVRFKLDTRVSGNLVPVSVYHELFPDHNIKDLGKNHW